ncbi:hypothetical protein FOA52_012243 [Chlamydomonas sp. UWO 241]|nr:hypothetical protein FOA52_012243 [Chlamydomonas sp. UWO 241]
MGLAMASELASGSGGGAGSSAVSTLAAALAAGSVLACSVHRPYLLTAKAEEAEIDDELDAGASGSPQGWWSELGPIVSVFAPRKLLMVFGRSVGLQVLLKFNVYMMQLLDHENRCIEAEQVGQQTPPAPPLPDWKPCFDRGLWLGCRELSVSVVRKVFEAIAVRRLGYSKAQCLLRDHKAWIKDVLSFKHRLAPPHRRFVIYAFSVFHSSALFFCADATVAIVLHVHQTARKRDKTKAEKAASVGRGVVAQVLRAALRLAVSSAGASVGSLLQPGIGTHIGFIAFDMAAMALTNPMADYITGGPAAAALPHPDQPPSLPSNEQH